MQKLTLKSIIFLIIILFTISPIFVTGEIKTVQNIIKTQQENPNLLYGTAYIEKTKEYKVKLALETRPEIVAIGTSRTMQFRDVYFHTSFITMGGVIADPYHIKNILEILESKNYRPSVILLGLDQYFFNDNWLKNTDESNNENLIEDKKLFTQSYFNEIKHSLSSFKPIVDQFIADYSHKKFSFTDLYDNQQIGMNAKINENGFRYDGSYQYGKIINDRINGAEIDFKDSLTRIIEGNQRFEYGETASLKALHEIEVILEYCKLHDIEVIGFMPPYAPSVINSMTFSGKYKYIEDASEQLNAIFNNYNFSYFDFTDSTKLESDDSYFVDGFHGGEIYYAKMILDMAKTNNTVNKVINENLENLIENRSNNLEF